MVTFLAIMQFYQAAVKKHDMHFGLNCIYLTL